MKKINCPNVAKNLFILLIVSLVFAIYFQSNAYALTSDNINFQGKIVRNDTGYEGLNVVPGSPACVVSGAGNDTCDFQVAYYTASTAGTLLLTETFTNVEIGQYDGVFELSLGSGSMTTTGQCRDGTCNTPVEVISEYKDVYLELKFSPDGTNLTETFTRMPLEASPYAILSKYAEGANDAFKLSTSVSSQSQASPVTGMIYYNTTTSQLTVYDGDSWEGVKSSLWTDAGTFTYLTSTTDDLILGASTVADSTFFFDMDGGSGSYLEIDDASNTNRLLTILSGGNVGIGTATPGAKLEVAGSSSTITNASGNLTISTGGLNGDILLSPHGTGRVLVSTKFGIKDTGATPTHYTFFQGGNQSADITYTLPTADGTASGQVLTTNASGVLSWQTVATGSTAWDDILDPDSNSVIVHGAYSTDMQFDTFTAGSAFKISSAATGLTGSLLDVSLSGSNAANTGNLFALNNTGTLNTGTSFLINHFATGTGNLAFRVNDESGDTTPFVIDGAGNVGIGTSTPRGALDVMGDEYIGSTSTTNKLVLQTSTLGQYLLTFQKNGDPVTGFTMGAGGSLSLSGGPRQLGVGTLVADTAIRMNGDGYFITGTGVGGSHSLIFKNDANVEVARFLHSGNLGLGVTTPTGVLHLKAGTATAETAPLKFTTGVNLTNAESGAMEWDGSRLYMTNTTPTRNTLAYLSDLSGFLTQGYQTIQEEGGAGLTQRSIFNFVGSGFTATDDGANTRTNITLNSKLNAYADLVSANGVLTNTSGTLSWVDLNRGDELLPTGTEGQMLYSNAGTWTAHSGMYWDDVNSRLGIGTTSPSYKVDASGDIRATGNLYVGSTPWVRIDASSAWANFRSLGSGGNMLFFLNFAGTEYERMRILASGNVGIGTTSPDYTLQVNGTIAPETTAQDLGTTSLRWDVFGVTGDFASSATTTSVLNVLANSLTTGTAQSISTTATGLTTGGLLSLSATGAPSSSWAGALGLIEYNNTDADVDGSALKLGLLGTDALGSGTVLNITTSQTGAGALAFRVNDDGTYTDSTPFVVDRDGNVGIGLIAPTEKFQVLGGIKYEGEIHDTSLVGHYSFNIADTSVATVYNEEGTGNNGTRGGDAIYSVDAISGNSMSFDGTLDAVSIPINMLFGKSAVTLSAWFRTTDSAGGLISHYLNSSTYVYNLFINSGKLNVCFAIAQGTCSSTTAQITSTANVDDGKWHSALATWDGTTVRLYLDGINIGQYALTGSVPSGMSLHSIGFTGYYQTGIYYPQGPAGLQGVVDDVKLYSRVLDTDEIMREYTRGTSRLGTSSYGDAFLGGNLGIGLTSPTGVLHLKAGTAAASTAPLKFTTGVNLTAAESGAMEWDGSRLYMTNTTPTRNTLAYLSDLSGFLTQGYQTIQEEGGAGLTQRSIFNFVGSGFTATDDGANTRTNITLNSKLNAYADLVSANGVLTNTSGTLSWVDLNRGDELLPTGTEGQMLYSNAGTWTAFGGMYWDDVNSRLGIGSSTPDGKLRVHDSRTAPTIYSTDWGGSYTTSNGNLIFNASDNTYGAGFPNIITIGGNSAVSIPSSSMGFSTWGSTNAVFAQSGPTGGRTAHNIAGYQQMSSQDAGNHSYNLYLYSDGGAVNTNLGGTPSHTNIMSVINKGSGTSLYNVYGIYSSVAGNTSDNAVGYSLFTTASGFGTNYAIYSAAGINYFSGNVGIGTTAPTRLLDVNGAMRLRGQMYDYNNEVGTPGQVLSTTATGVDWISLAAGHNAVTLAGENYLSIDGNQVLTASDISLTSNVTGTLGISNGGTNSTTYTSSQFLWYNGTSIVASGYDNTSFATSSHTHNWSQITNGVGIYMDYKPNNSACSGGQVLKYTTGTGWTCANDTDTNTDVLVAIDSSATAGYIGATGSDGVLRVSSPISLTDGGDYITLGITANSITGAHLVDDTLDYVDFDDTLDLDANLIQNQSTYTWTQNFTGTTTTGLTYNANSLTSGTANLISSTSTAGIASGSSYLLRLDRSGANANTAHTAYGVYSTVTNTNATSGTNIAGYFSASGATTANYGLIVASGNVGIGDTTPASLLTVGNGDLFQVNTSGDLIKIKNVTYSWPSSNGSGILTNNGSGTLSWTPGTVDTDDQRWNEILDPNANKTFTMGSYTTDFQYNTFEIGSAYKLSSTSVLGTVSSSSIMLEIAKSGANTNVDHTAYGIFSTVTNTNATSGTNIAGYFSASGATTANYGLLVANGNVGIGTTTPSNKFVVNTSGYSTIELQYGGTSVVDIFSNASSNIFIGLDSGSVISTGTGNIALGDNALSANTTGLSNTAIGHYALDSNVAKQGSTALGYQAMMYANSTATAGLSYNTAIGYQALTGSGIAANNTGTQNTAVGHQSMTANTSGSSNTALGVNTLNANTTGTENVAIGQNALFTNVAKQGSVAIGYEAMRYANNTATANQSFNTAVGYQALMGSSIPANNLGDRNTVFGYQSGMNMTSGGSNTLIGVQAGYSNTTGYGNVAIGADSLSANATGTRNVVIGQAALGTNATGDHSDSVAIGYYSMGEAGGGTAGNVGLGRSTLFGVSGNYNTALGYGAGQDLTNGSYNILIGYNVQASTITSSNELNIGNTIYGNLSNDSVSIGATPPSGAMFAVGATSQFRVDTSGDLIRIKNVPYVWPSSNASGILANNGSGTLSWSTIASLGGVTGTGSGTATAGQIAWWNGTSTITGENDFYWDASNKRLGIGTSTPTASIDIAGASSTISNASGNITITPASNLIVSQGSVGVGTSSIISGVKLQVQEDYAGTNDLQVPLSIVRTTSGTAANGMGVGIDFRLEDSATNLIGAAQIFGLWENASSTSTAGALTFRTSGDGTALAERMRISSSGIVGIGTTSPISTANNKLDVFNSTTLTNMTVSTVDYATVNILSGTVSGTYGFGDFSVNAYYDGSTWTKRNTSYESWIMGLATRQDSAGKIEFVHSDAGTGFTMTKPMTIKPNSVNFGDYLEVFSGNAKTVSTPFIRASSGNNLVLNAYSTGGVFVNWDATGSGGFYVGDGAGTGSANYVFSLASGVGNRGRIYSQANDSLANSTDTYAGMEVGPYRVAQAASSNTLYEYYSNASSVAYRIMTTGTAMDLAEWYPVGNIDLDTNGNSKLKKGEILCLDNNDATKVVKCDSTHTNVVGIVSTASYTTMGIRDMDDLREDDVEVALTGRVPAIVTSKNGPIAIGDFITYSDLRGVGQKATSKVQVVAKALDTFNPSSCSPASSLESISWPVDEDGDNPTKPCYQLPDGTYVGKIMVFPNISVFNPNETYTTKLLINNGWYRIAQLNGTDANAKFKIKNNSVGSYQNLLLNIDTVFDKDIVNIVSNFTSGGYDISKARINNVGGIKYLEIYLEEVNNNNIVVNIDEQQGDWISTSITQVIDIPSISNEFAFNGVLFGISDVLQVEDTGLKVGGDLIASTTTANIGDTTSRWNDIYAKGAIRLGSGSGQEGAIRFNTESKRLELSNDGSTWVQLGDLTSQMVISAEYPGAILFADGSDNLGKMTSDAIEENATFKNYYEWISNKEVAQDYDILVRITLPNDFVSWKDDAIYLDYMTQNSVSVENNSVDVTLIGNSGVDAQSVDHISTLPGAWERMSLKSLDINDCNAPGDSCTLRISLTSSMEYFTRVGDITLNYNRSL